MSQYAFVWFCVSSRGTIPHSLYLIVAFVMLSQTLEPLISAQFLHAASKEKEPNFGLLLERLVTQVWLQNYMLLVCWTNTMS